MARKRFTFFSFIQVVFLKATRQMKRQNIKLFVVLFWAVLVSLLATNVQAHPTSNWEKGQTGIAQQRYTGVGAIAEARGYGIALQQRDGGEWENLARESYAAGEFQEAAKYWQQAASAFEVKGDWLNQAIALSNLSLTYQQLGRWQEANSAIALSRSLLPEEKSVKSPEELKAIAQTLDIQGNLQWEQGQVNSALDTWQKSANIYVKLKDELGRKRSLIAQVKAMQELGFYEQACQALIPVIGWETQEKLTTCEQLTNTLTNTNSLDTLKNILAQSNLVNANLDNIKLTGVRLLGDVLRKLGSLDKSLKLLQTVEPFISQQKFPEEKALVLLSLGNTYEALWNRNRLLSDSSDSQANNQKDYYPNALYYYRQAVIIAETLQVKIHAQLNLFSLLSDSQIENNANFKEEAEKLHLVILSQLSKLPPSRQKVYAEISLIKNLYRLKEEELKAANNLNLNNENAEKLANYCLPDSIISESLSQNTQTVSWREIVEMGAKAVKLARDLDDGRAKAYALGNLGWIYEHKKQWLEAQQCTQQALLLSQNVKLNLPDLAYQWQWQLGRIRRDKEKTDIEGAIAAYTAAFNTLQSVRNDLVPISRDGQFDFRDQIEPVYRDLVDLLLRDPDQPHLKQAREVIEALQVAELDNFFREACIQVRDINIDNLDDKESAVIYPIILKDRLEVIVKLPNSLDLKHYSNKSVSQKTINDTLIELNQIIREPDYFKKDKNQLLSQNIYSWLLKPAEADLAKSQVKTLVFVLDGALRNIPMAALYDGKKYLIESYSLALAPGLKLIDPKQLNLRNSKVLTAGISEARQGFYALPNVKKELEEIQSQVSSIVLFNDKFTNLALQAQINSQTSRIVHLATHGVFSSNAENTFIIAWDERININELNQLLRTRDGNRSKPIELLVLSACQTAAGDNRATLGLAGVAVRAGARSTLASLWNIPDDSTAVLMKEFYKQLLVNKQSKAEALRQAQLFLLKHPQNAKYNTPAAWSPYILVGNWL